MLPDNSHNQQITPSSLPLVATDQSIQEPAVGSQGGAPTTLAPERTTEHYALQAKQLAIKYANDPYKLSEALGQLKTAYLSEQYHITSNQTGN